MNFTNSGSGDLDQSCKTTVFDANLKPQEPAVQLWWLPALPNIVGHGALKNNSNKNDTKVEKHK